MARRSAVLVAPVVWSLYLLWRAPGWGWSSGVPLTPVATAMLATVWWQWWVRARLPLTKLLCVLTAVKIVVSPILVERGFSATQFNSNHWAGAPEHGLYHPGVSDTRLDPTLAFGGPGQPDLPLFYQNDSARFNFYRGRIGYSVIWSGYLDSGDREPVTIYLKGGPGLSAFAEINGFRVAELKPAETDAVGRVNLKPRLYRLEIRLAGSKGASRAFEAGLVESSGQRRPFDASMVVPVRPVRWRLAVDRTVRWVSPLADAAATIILCWGLVVAFYELATRARDWRRLLVGLGAIVALVEAFWFASAFLGRLMLQGAGQDWLTYETYARDILFHGPLMTLGKPVGAGSAYYYQPLYAYFLALAHLAFGESLWGIYFLQRLLLAVTILTVWSMGELLFGARIGLATLAAAVWFVAFRVSWLSGILLNEVLFIPLLVLWTASLCRLAVKPSRRESLASGVWGGLASLARSTLVLAWPVVYGLLFYAYRRRGWRLALVAASLILTCAVVGQATLRNWIVARTVVPITTSFPVNLYLGNPVPPGIPGRVNRGQRLRHDADYVQLTFDFIKAQPRAFLTGLGYKTAFTLGWFGALGGKTSVLGAQTSLIVTWVLALAGSLALFWPGVGDGTPGPARAIPLLIALAHFAVVVLVFPNVSRDRLILPMYVLLLPYAGIVPSLLLTRLVAKRKD